MQALFGDLEEGVKVAGQVKARKDTLVAAGSETAMQLAQLVALEYLLGTTIPARIKEVRTITSHATLACLYVFLEVPVPEDLHPIAWAAPCASGICRHWLSCEEMIDHGTFSGMMRVCVRGS